MRRNLTIALIIAMISLLIIPASFYAYTQGINNTSVLRLMVFVIAVLVIGGGLLYAAYLRGKINKIILEKNKLNLNQLENQNLFETLFANLDVGIGIVSLDGHFTRANAALCTLLGYSQFDLLEKNFYYIIHPNDQNNLQANIQQLLDDKISIIHAEQQCYRKDGEAVWVTLTLSLIRGEFDKPTNFLIQLQNVTIQKKAEERLRHMAYHDALTGLANRNKLEQFITHILASSRRHQHSFALLFLDIDRFKNINDGIGHEAGDLLLQIVAERLKSAVRNTDIVARLGGDEFVVVITDVEKSDSMGLIAQKILENVMEVIVVKGQEIYATTSIGISLYPYDGQDLPTLMKNADLALYRAKEKGRNNYQFYTLEMTSKAQEKIALQNVLGHALVKNEFFMHYQPIMDLRTREIISVEALLRWKNNEYSYITPEEIITVAEECGLIHAVSEWIITTACQQLKIWHDMGMTSLTVAINCSGHQFKHSSLTDDVVKVITEVGIPASSLVIEVTESTVMQDPDHILRVLYALKDLGVKIAIDDFGTGYWSLSNLRRLDVDIIKIDKTFVKMLTRDDTSGAITSAIIAMMNKLSIKSIAEGVENKDQYDFLEFEGCNAIQGYYITRPLDAEAMTAFLKHPLPDAEVIKKREMTSDEE